MEPLPTTWDGAPMPEFGATVPPGRAEPCSARELFCCLFVEPEEHVHYLEPALRFVMGALATAPLPPLDRDDPVAYVDGCIAWARASLPVHDARAAAESWPARVAREFAPSGLCDGAWLRGSVQANTVETEVGMWMLKQLMIRFGDPGGSESYVQRYAALLRSLGVTPDAISRWEFDEVAPCADISYEHALLGLAIGLFPTTLAPETLGFNLWMASVGPCPLLARLGPALEASGACLRYLRMHDGDAMAELATQAVYQHLLERDDPETLLRIGRGFAAAHQGYVRWEAAMHGRNVPFFAGDFVREALARKLRYEVLDASLPHADAPPCDVRDETLLAHLADAAARPSEQRAASSFAQRALATLTRTERADLAAWQADRALRDQPRPSCSPVPLAGVYAPPQDLGALERFAFETYAGLSNAELYHRFANADLHPAIALFARAFVAQVLAKLAGAFDGDARLNSQQPPPYAERVVAELVAAQHLKNVHGRKPTLEALHAADDPEDTPEEYIGAIFDGCWLQGFADVRRADFEEYGWLFRIYASEHGDGDMEWNHSRIFRREFAPLGSDVMLPKTDERLYKLFDVGAASVAKLAIALNTRYFMPEILGMNLGIEASGVGGTYLERWKRAEGKGLKWEALAARLHNSIDNYADGHTKWSLSAVQAFMRRVKDVAPAELPALWHRIWRLWRLQDILSHGTESEQSALAEHLSLRSLAPT